MTGIVGLNRARPKYDARTGVHRLRMKPLLLLAVLSMTGALVMGSTASVAATPKSTLHFAVFVAYSGSSSYEGPESMAGCLSGVAQVNAHGGVLGHPIACVAEDATSDPADSVPATTKMLTSVSNLEMVLGPSEVAPPDVPIISAAHIPMVAQNSSPQYDNNTDPWFYRILPSDALTADAMGVWAITHHITKAVTVFTNSIGAQTVVQPLGPEFKSMGGTITQAIALQPDQSSYQTEAAALVADHPAAVFSEIDAETAATFWSEVLQIGGSIPNVIGDHATSHAVWTTAVTQAVGAANYNFVSISPSGPTPGPGYSLFLKNLRHEGGKVVDAEQYNSDPTTISTYDEVIFASLAMTAAKTISPAGYQPYIAGKGKVQGVTGTVSGGMTVVHTYAQGLAALKDGRTIRYFGAGGQIAFNKYQNAASNYTAYKYDPQSQSLVQIGTVSSATIAKYYKS